MKKTFTILSLLVCVLLLTSGTIDLGQLFDYSGQQVPRYINEDNTNTNPITDGGATLGRVLFYDKNLSSDRSTACASCHIQSLAFGDVAQVSQGVNGLTGRHSMRLVNARFGQETQFFWDERANTLEEQTTMPIRDHGEMGFSGEEGDPDFADLIERLEGISYYGDLFDTAYGDRTITEEKMQNALAQFVRSIQSFDSKYDEGIAAANGNRNANFSNFTTQENTGKNLFSQRPVFDNNSRRTGGGLGCETCHRAPEFDIDPNSRNNGVIGVANNPGATDLTNTRSPSLRDLFGPTGVINGPMMHDGSMATIDDVLDHYNDITYNRTTNNQLDPRLRGNNAGGIGGGNLGQKLLMTTTEREALKAFLKTLTGTNVYTDERWADPFDEHGNLELIGGSVIATADISLGDQGIEVLTIPEDGTFTLSGALQQYDIQILNQEETSVQTYDVDSQLFTLDVSAYRDEPHYLSIRHKENMSLSMELMIE